MLEMAASQVEPALEQIKQCMLSGVWPSYSSEVELIDLPSWYGRENETVEIEYVEQD
jgi:hypothetical protein